MFPNIAINLFLAVAAIPFIYYLLALYSSWNYFRQRTPSQSDPNFTPPISNLKPIRGLDPDAYENFASFCRQDYPDYEILFCVGDADDPVLPVIEKLIYDFPECKIRVLYGSGRIATNDKVAKLARLVDEAATKSWSSATVMFALSPTISAASWLRSPIPTSAPSLASTFRSPRRKRLSSSVCRRWAWSPTSMPAFSSPASSTA